MRRPRKWKDTSVFKTDIWQVFDFIRYSKNKEQVKKLVLDCARALAGHRAAILFDLNLLKRVV